MTSETEKSPDVMAIILHSDSYDRVTDALSLAVTGMTMGMEAYILLMYQGLKRFVRGHFEDVGETDPGLYDQIQKGIDSGRLYAIEDKLATARELGLKLYACPAAMAAMGIAREDLIEEVDDVMGLAAFVKIAKSAAINWYI